MAETDKGAASGERLGVGRARATHGMHMRPAQGTRQGQAGKAGPPSDETTTRGAAPRHACRDPLLISSACTQIFSPTPAGVASISGSFEFGARPRPVAADMGIKNLLPRLFRWQ
jgi:hypothetical protein